MFWMTNIHLQLQMQMNRCCRNAQNGGKEFAKALFDCSVHKTGWKLILFQNTGTCTCTCKLLNVVVEVHPGVIGANDNYMYMNVICLDLLLSHKIQKIDQTY